MKKFSIMELKLLLKGLFGVFWVFFRIGSVTFGGGYAMLPLLEEELSIKRKWTNREELLDYFAIGQCTPGIIAVNVSTFVGYKRHGIIGGVFGTLGMVFPSIIIITGIAAFLSNFSHIDVVQKAFAGINVAVAALLIKVSVTFAKSSIKKVFQIFVSVASFILVLVFNVQTVWIVFSSIALGIVLHYSINNRKKTSEHKGDTQ